MPFVPLIDVEPPWVFGISALLGIGSIILPGNWCRIIAQNGTRSAPDVHSVAMLKYEKILEQQRNLLMPEAPSRLESVFVSPNLESARAFAAAAYNRTDVLYFVEPLLVFERIFVASWTLYNTNDLLENVSENCHQSDQYLAAQMQLAASLYWLGPSDGSARELLVPCGLRVVGRVSSKDALPPLRSVSI